MPELLKMFTPGSGASPRRGVLRALASVGAGSILGGLGTQSANAKKGKNKNKGKNRCKKKCKTPSGDECPSSCAVRYVGVGQNYCGQIAHVAEPCAPCTSNSDCTGPGLSGYPYCVTEGEILATGQKLPVACEGSPPGQCVQVWACGDFT